MATIITMAITTGIKPLTSYDSGCEHSFELWIEVQRLVREEEGEFPPCTLAADHL
jgi:hypothetical protein